MILLSKDFIINLYDSCSCPCCCVIHNNNIFLLLCNTQQQQHHTITSKLTEMFYRNKCMTDLSSCSTPNDKIYKVTTYIKLHRMKSCIPCTAFWFRVILGELIINFTLVNLKIESSLSGLARLPGGVYCQFYPGKTDFSLYLSLVSVCLYICTRISLNIPIS